MACNATSLTLSTVDTERRSLYSTPILVSSMHLDTHRLLLHPRIATSSSAPSQRSASLSHPSRTPSARLPCTPAALLRQHPPSGLLCVLPLCLSCAPLPVLSRDTPTPAPAPMLTLGSLAV